MEQDGTFENTQNLQILEIYALSGCKEKLDWGEGRKLISLYDKKTSIPITNRNIPMAPT